MIHIIGIINELLQTIIRYVSIILILVFDAIIFSYPMIIINNNILNNLYNVPELNYLQGVGIIFLYKLFALLWKSVKIEHENNVVYVENKQEIKETN